MSGLLAIALLIILLLGSLVVHLYKSNKTKDVFFEIFTDEIKGLKGEVDKAHVLIHKLKLRIHEYEKNKKPN